MLKNNNIAYAIVPDVHGRKFWEDSKQYDCPVIFLGDYLSPYRHEGITEMEAIKNFENILDFANSRDNVTLLVGNHDATVMIGRSICDCRTDHIHYFDNRMLYWNNLKLFKFCKRINAGGKEIMLSHAGFNPIWIDKWKKKFDDIIGYFENYNLDEDIDLLRSNSQFSVRNALSDFSLYRGGLSKGGSVLWSDIRDYVDVDLSVLPFEQIVGHTMLTDKPIGVKGITCIDTSTIYFIDNEGNLLDYMFEKVEPIDIIK